MFWFFFFLTLHFLLPMMWGGVSFTMCAADVKNVLLLFLLLFGLVCVVHVSWTFCFLDASSCCEMEENGCYLSPPAVLAHPCHIRTFPFTYSAPASLILHSVQNRSLWLYALPATHVCCILIHSASFKAKTNYRSSNIGKIENINKTYDML